MCTIKKKDENEIVLKDDNDQWSVLSTI